MRRIFAIAKLDGWRNAMAPSCVLAVALAACGFPRPPDVAPDPGAGDFTATLDAARVRVSESSSTTVGINLNRNGFSGPVTLTVTGLPAGVTADPLTIDGKAGTLTLRAASGVTQGDAALTVTAMGGDRAHDVPLSLLAMGLPGTMDKSFGSANALQVPIAGHGEKMAIQPDGKILVAGWVTKGSNTDMVARFLPDGTPDTSFANGMQLLDITTAGRFALTLQPDGKIVVAETSGGKTPLPELWRLNADGSYDSQFGIDGREVFDLSDQGAQHSTILTSVAVQPGGNIVVAGHADILLSGSLDDQAVIAQFTSRGALDQNFGTAGRTFTGLGLPNASFFGLAQQPGGRLVTYGLAGPSDLVTFARFEPDGNLDSSFSGGGFFSFGHGSTTSVAAVIMVEADGKIVAAGSANGTYMVRLNGESGASDAEFGEEGFYQMTRLGTASFATGLAVQSDGKYLIVGNIVQSGAGPFMARIYPNQLFDTSFGNDGVVMPIADNGATRFQAVALDSDGRIVVTGFRSTGLGSPDELLLYRFWP